MESLTQEAQRQVTLLTTPKKSMGSRNRNVGNGAERLYAKAFRDLGFSHCITSREGSRLYDSCAIDLIFLPVLVQIKAGKQKGMNPSNILNDITTRIKTSFPETEDVHGKPKIVIHHKTPGRGKPRTEFDSLVYMSFNDFVKFLMSYSKINDNT